MMYICSVFTSIIVLFFYWILVLLTLSTISELGNWLWSFHSRHRWIFLWFILLLSSRWYLWLLLILFRCYFFTVLILKSSFVTSISRFWSTSLTMFFYRSDNLYLFLKNKINIYKISTTDLICRWLIWFFSTTNNNWLFIIWLSFNSIKWLWLYFWLFNERLCYNFRYFFY